MAELASATGGTLLQGDPFRPFQGASIDSRTVARRNVFFAIPGSRTDGHDYLGVARKAGATGAVVERRVSCPAGFPLLRVASSKRALLAGGAWYRGRFHLPVVAITGSNGKTTTKDMTAWVLEQGFPGGVLATRGNLNNHLGVPLTLFGLGPGSRVAVLELAMNHKGEIARLARAAAPGIGVVLNASEAHLMSFGGVEGVAKAKAELLRELPAGGWAIINSDDERVWSKRGLTRARVLGFGVRGGEVRAEGVRLDSSGRAAFVLRTPDGKARARLAVPGSHNALNAAAAAAVAWVLGLPTGTIARRLSSFRPRAGMRMESCRLRGGAAALVDCYNANPASMRAALEHLRRTGARRPVLVLGEMLELGRHGAAAHRSLGRLAASLKPSLLVGVGPGARGMVAAARTAGAGRAVWVREPLDAAVVVREAALSGRTVLLKGSRKVGLERLSAALGRGASRAV
jgi:UDP-N-acetylmuramoyl-tripeptide--D-alanyl-D-alanine ligase